MPANEELRLVAKIIDVGALRPVIDEGITLDNFLTLEGHPAFEYVWHYWHDRKTNGVVPTRELFETRNPTIVLPPEDRLPLDAVIKEFKNCYVTERLVKIGEEIIDYAVDDPDRVLCTMMKEVAALTRVRRVSQDLHLSESMQQAASDYEHRKNMEGLPGIPYPWEELNNESGGMLDGDYNVIFGRPKSMKTWVLLYIACHAYNYHNRRILIYTREMTPEQIRDRCACLLIDAPYSAYRKGVLNQYPCPSGHGTLENRFYEIVESMTGDEKTCMLESGYDKGLIITSDREDPQGGGVNGLRQKIEDHKPDLICVDGMYLMRNDRENRRSIKWRDQYAISQDIRDVCLDFKRPLLATTQGNREGKDNFEEGTEDVAFADSVGMDCTTLIKVMKKRTPDPEVNELALLIKASREMNMVGFAINGCAASNFGQLMQKVVNPENNQVLKDGNGNPLLAPVVFHDPNQIKEMFKKEKADEKESRTNLVAGINRNLQKEGKRKARGR